MSLGLEGKHIFVTGASGFIGARLAECLTSVYGATVHVLVHRAGTVGTARLARLRDVRLFHGDVLDGASVREAATGCSHYVHCAIGNHPQASRRSQVTVEGTRTVLEAASSQMVERVVYVSSASVHDLGRSDGPISEQSPIDGHGLAQDKARGEALVRDYEQRSGLRAVIIRPTCVWGPFSPVWTVGAVDAIRRHIPFLPLEGQGTANLVYIDNLVDALCLGLVKPAAVGQAFLINDDGPTTWGELYGGYAKFLGVPLRYAVGSQGAAELLRVSGHNAVRLVRHMVTSRAPWNLQLLRELYDRVPLVKVAVGTFPDVVQTRLRKSASSIGSGLTPGSGAVASESGFIPYTYLAPEQRTLYGLRNRYDSAKAKRLLGWVPRLSYEEAMARTCAWYDYASYRR